MEGNSLECFICFNSYDLHTHLPRILPLCGHTICENCLKDILKSARPQCPLDKIVFAGKDMSSFPQNYALKGMLQSNPKSKESNHNHEEQTDRSKKIQELNTLVDEIEHWTFKASQELESRHKLMKMKVETHFEKLFKALEEKKKMIDEKLNEIFIENKTKLKDDLETYEFQKIDILNIIKDSEKNNNHQSLMMVDTYLITGSLADAKKSFELVYRSRINELTQSLSQDLSAISSHIAQLDIKSNPKENHEGIQRHAPLSNVAFKITSIPNYSDENVTSIADKLGPFVHDDDQEEDHNLPFFPPYQFVKDNSIYRGQWKKGKRHGRGECYWTDGSRYVGYWRDGKGNGNGRLIYSSGDVYEGEWLNNKAHGKGIFTNFDGSRYEGDWYEDKYHGKGIETWTDGSRFEGEYVNGKKQGKGVFTYSDGKKYVGEYVNDLKEGYGEFDWPDGTGYKGQWLNDKQHGKGIYILSKDERWEGQWVDGKRVHWI